MNRVNAADFAKAADAATVVTIAMNALMRAMVEDVKSRAPLFISSPSLRILIQQVERIDRDRNRKEARRKRQARQRTGRRR